MRCQDGSDDSALGPRPAAMNQADFAEALLNARPQVLADDVGDVPGGKGVKIEAVLDRQDYLAFILQPIHGILILN
jgi:hypothetical protein